MPTRVEVNGNIIEFPDGMGAPEIEAAIKANIMSIKPKAAPAGPQEGVGEAMLVAAGRGTDKLAQGVRQAFNWATGDQAALDRMAGEEAEKDRLYKPLADARPYATGIGEMAPGVAAAMLTGGTSMVGAAAANALPSLLSYGSAEDRVKRAAVDGAFGAAGAGAGKLLARGVKPAGVGSEPVSDTVLGAAKRLGYQPTAGQITQNPAMQNFENYLLRSPGSSGRMQKVVEGNQAALNRAGAKAMGESAESLGEDVFSGASKRIGDEFGRLSDVTRPKLGDEFVNALESIGTQNAQRGPFASKSIDNLIDKSLDLAAKGDLDGVAYKQIRTELSNQAQAAFRAGDATTGQAYKSVVSALDKAAKESLSDADKAAWDTARKEWAAFKTLTKSNVAEGGNVSAARTAAALRSKGPQLRTGQAQGELADIARIGEAFKGVSNPNSGQLSQQMMYGNPLTGLPMMLGNKAMAAAYMSPAAQRYMANGLLDLGPGGQALLARSGGLLGVAGGRSLLGVE
jgi:hypothetical protein